MKRTLKRELKVPEIASMEAIETGQLHAGLRGDFRSADLLCSSSVQKSTPVTGWVTCGGEGRPVLSGTGCYSSVVVPDWGPGSGGCIVCCGCLWLTELQVPVVEDAVLLLT